LLRALNISRTPPTPSETANPLCTPNSATLVWGAWQWPPTL